MPLSRIHRNSAAVLAVILLLLLPSVAHAQTPEELIITANGVGNAELGLSAEELATALGSEYDLGNEVRITVDFDGRVVTRDGSVQFRAAKADNNELLTLFIVSNPDYATSEGVGPTTTIAQAESIYGAATLSWNPDNEGREFVSFANGPEGRIAFRTPGIGGTNVGVYADGEFETGEYESGAAIAAIWVSCISGQDCPQDRAAVAPTPTSEPEPTATPEPAPEPTPTPEPAPEPTPDSTPAPAPTATPTAPGSTGTDGELPTTGATELVLLSLVSVLFVIGGAFVLMERRYLCPEWLNRS